MPSLKKAVTEFLHPGIRFAQECWGWGKGGAVQCTLWHSWKKTKAGNGIGWQELMLRMGSHSVVQLFSKNKAVLWFTGVTLKQYWSGFIPSAWNKQDNISLWLHYVFLLLSFFFFNSLNLQTSTKFILRVLSWWGLKKCMLRRGPLLWWPLLLKIMGMTMRGQDRSRFSFQLCWELALVGKTGKKRRSAELQLMGLPHNCVSFFFYIDDVKQVWQKEAMLF